MLLMLPNKYDKSKNVSRLGVNKDSQKVLNVPRILNSTLIMFLNIEAQKLLPKSTKFEEIKYKSSIILGNIYF